MDDYKSFSYTYSDSKGNRFSDGYYGLKLKNIKQDTWGNVVNTLKDSGGYYR